MQNWNWFVLFRISLSLWKIKSFLSSDVCFCSDLHFAERKKKQRESYACDQTFLFRSPFPKRSFHPVSSLSMLLQSCWQVQTLTITPVWPFTRPFWPFHIITKLDFRLFADNGHHAGLAIWPNLFAFQSSSHHPAQESKTVKLHFSPDHFGKAEP